MGIKTKLDDKACNANAPVPIRPVGLVEQYIGSSYDIVKQVFDNLEALKLISENLSATQGAKGDTATVVDNGDGTYTITGGNGSVTWSDGLASTNIHEIQQYSIDGATSWHSVFVTGDIFKRVSIVTSGIAAPFGTAYKIVSTDGTNGSTVTRFLEFNYSADNIAWHDVIVATDFYRRERVVTDTDGNIVNGTWSTGVLVRIDGINGTDGLHGNFIAFAFKTATTVPSTPTGGSFDGTTFTPPSGWDVSATSPTTDAQAIYLIKATFSWDGTTWNVTTWSSPAQISGDVGLPGRFTSFIFQNAVSVPAIPTGGTYDGTTETMPTGWTTNPSVPAAGETTWSTTVEWSFAASTWTKGAWSTVFQFAGLDGITPVKDVDYFDGAAGVHGSFVTLMFRNNSTALTAPVNGSYDGTTEVPPTNWSSAPVDVAEGDTRYITRRVYSYNGTTWDGSTWSLPTAFGGSGTGGAVVEELHMDPVIPYLQSLTNILKDAVIVNGAFDETVQRKQSDAAIDALVKLSTTGDTTTAEITLLTITVTNSLKTRVLTLGPVEIDTLTAAEVRPDAILTLKSTAFGDADALEDTLTQVGGGTGKEVSRTLSVTVPLNTNAGTSTYFLYLSQGAGNILAHTAHNVKIDITRVSGTLA